MPQSCQAMCKSNGSSGVTRQRARSTQNVQLDYWVRIRPIHNIGIICYLPILYNYIADVLFKYLMDIDVSGHLRKKIKVLRTDGGGGAFFTFLIGIVVVIVGMCTYLLPHAQIPQNFTNYSSSKGAIMWYDKRSTSIHNCLDMC